MNQPQKSNCCFKSFVILLGILGLLGATVLGAVIFWTLKTTFKPTPTPDTVIITDLRSPSESETSTDQSITEVIDERLILVSEEDTYTQNILINSAIPVNDPIELAGRIGGISDAPVYRKALPQEKNIETNQNFWVLDVDTNEYRQIDAKLTYITPHLYFWVEEGIITDAEAIAELAETFENEIYPTTREIFGSEWSPGVDQDVHLTILYARGLGGAAGYFSSTDSLTKEVEPYSNETEMFYLSADYTYLNSPYTYGVLAHELQHMIHWNIDRNESAWVNEGLSELAVELNGYNTGGFSFFFAIDPDLQLNYWPGNEQGDSTPHYGASYLFVKYLMDRFGIESIKELVASEEVGLTSIDEVYSKYGAEFRLGYTAEKLFQDWSVANFTHGADYQRQDRTNKRYDVFPVFFPTETVSCNSTWQERTVKQFGTDYIAIDCPVNFKVELSGNSLAPLLPVEPYSGNYYFWSNYGDSSDMTLTKNFDFTGVKGDIIMNYWAWYDLENDYDYLYLTASTDGETWEILNPTKCTRTDPTGSNYGCGYNGQSGGWISEAVDLTRYAGYQVALQFEYITDLAVNGDGFLVDDISISKIGYFTDFEFDSGGWDGMGFVRVNNVVPQNYGISLIIDSAHEKSKKVITIGGLEFKETFSYQNGVNNPVIAISGLTRFTRQPAEYQIRVSPQE